MKYKTYQDNDHLYFLTSRISGYKKIFIQEKYALIVTNSLDYLRKQKIIHLFSFCIMPNHAHILIKIKRKRTINEVVNRFHSYTAHQLLKKMRQEKNHELLNFFNNYAVVHKQDRRHLFWDDALVKNVFSSKALNNVVEYIHSNPNNKNWHLVEDRANYEYSSACFYDKGIKPIIEVDDIREFYK